jgi:hypothetical protein
MGLAYDTPMSGEVLGLPIGISCCWDMNGGNAAAVGLGRVVPGAAGGWIWGVVSIVIVEYIY